LDAASPQRMIDFVIEKHGRIDGLVNNAGRLDRCNIETLSDDLFEEMMTINTRAPLMLIKAALPHMEKQSSGGSVVNIGSTNAHCGAEKILLYSVNKGALMTATRNLADALASRLVRVNQMNVGWTETENEYKVQAAEGQSDDWINKIPDIYAPTGKILKSEEVAQHVAFWLSPKSAPVTGQVVDIEQYPVLGRLKFN
jgi:NAD(P)-dependent dehydrogenase (short-subunit alcohol dehydrogenase family)